MVGFWENGRNVTNLKKIMYLFIPFSELTYRSDPSTDFHAYGSNDADSRKDVPFGVLLILLPILGVKYPQNPQFWGCE